MRPLSIVRIAYVLLLGTSVVGFAQAPPRQYTPLYGQSEQAWRDFQYHYWDPDNKTPRIRPTGGDGRIRNDAAYPTFWHMAEAHNVLFWRWKITHSEPVREMIRSQFREIRARYTDAQLSSAAWTGYRADVIINVQDDASWVIAYFCQVHEATGDPTALHIAMALLNSTYSAYADPNHGGAGLLYALPGQDPSHQGVSSGYEVVAARCALYVFEQTSHGHYLEMAKGTWEWMHKYLRHPQGVYFAELDIRPTVNNQANPNYRKPIGWNRPGDIKRGGSIGFIGGTMGMASLSAELYMLTGERRYLDEVNSIVTGMLKPETFLRPGNLLVNDRDAWVDGFTAPYMAWDALSIDGVDPDGKLKSALIDTALSITRQRTSDGYYGADWSGPEWDPAHRWNTWADQGRAAGGGSGEGMAEPDQMPTTASGVAMVIAGAMAEQAARNRAHYGT